MCAELFLEKLAQGDIRIEDLEAHRGQTYAIDRLIAACPVAPPDLLATLAKSLDRETRRLVICNLGTTVDILMSLAKEFPREFFSHPMLDLMILENPKLLTRLVPGVLKSILNDVACPAAFVNWACRYGYKTDQFEVLKRTDLSADQLRIIARGPHPKAAERAIARLIKMGEVW